MLHSFLLAAALIVPASFAVPPAAEPVAATPPASAGHARIELLAAKAAAPGATFMVGVHFDLDPQWHIYSSSLNDSGMPPAITLTFPEGWTQGATRWPAPIRHISDIILDHVYEDSVTILIPVTVPPSAAPGGVHSISADVSYMICKNVCLLAKTAAEVKVALVEPSARPAEPPTPITRTLALLPKPLPDSGVEVLVNEDINTHDEIGRSLRVSGAVRLEFYPAADCVPLADLIEEGSVESGRIDLTYSKPIQRNTSAEATSNSAPGSSVSGASQPRFKGVLAVWRLADGVPAYYSID